VVYGPSTRRLIDLADAGRALGINPVGQSGVLFDRHFNDQADAYMRGEYVPMHLDAEAIKANSRSQLRLAP
jgi:penicillin amidase